MCAGGSASESIFEQKENFEIAWSALVKDSSFEQMTFKTSWVFFLSYPSLYFVSIIHQASWANTATRLTRIVDIGCNANMIVICVCVTTVIKQITDHVAAWRLLASVPKSGFVLLEINVVTLIFTDVNASSDTFLRIVQGETIACLLSMTMRTCASLSSLRQLLSS